MGLRALCAGALLILLGLLGSPPAAAAPDAATLESGLWYTERLHLDEIHQRGLTGEGVTIAVIDTGINTQAAELQGANITVKGRWCVEDDTGQALPADTTDIDLAGHGTSVAAMIVGNGTAADGGVGTRGVAPDAEIWFYGGSIPDPEGSVTCEAAQPPESDTDLTIPYPSGSSVGGPEEEFITGGTWVPEAMAALDAIRSGADVVSVSKVGVYSASWVAVVAEAVREGVPIVAGTANPARDDDPVLISDVPATMNGAVAVNAVGDDGEILTRDGKQAQGSFNLAFAAPGVDVLVPYDQRGWRPAHGSGTSYATPMVAAMIALGLQNDPEATANQVLQVMIRTTGNRELGEPEWTNEKYGYGIANPRGMLEADATEFPDENPLFVSDPDDPRCTDPFDGHQPGSIAECFEWAQAPLPGDVWPDTAPTSAPQATGEESPGGTEAGQAQPGTDPRPRQSGGVPPWVLPASGGALVVLLAVIGMIVANNRRRSRSSSTYNK